MTDDSAKRAVVQLAADDKRALLKKLLAHRIGASEFPLSHAQRALWLFHLLAPDTAAYNVAIVAAASPRLDRERLRRSLEAVITRHAALRTVVAAPDGVPVQRSSERLTCEIATIDAGASSEDELETLVAAEYRRPFDLGLSPLRVAVFSAAGRDVLLITVHHLVFDAVSAQILFEELRTAYEAFAREEVPVLPSVPATYREFVKAQSDLLESPRGAELWSYWKQRLSGAPPALALPDRPRVASPRNRRTSVPLTLGPETYAALNEIARQQRGTLVAVLLASYSLLLRGLSGQDEVIIGIPVSGRNRPEWANVVGYFVNMLPVRLTMPGNMSFREHVAKTAEELRNALAHQDFPFPLMVERLRVARVPGQSPIFQAMLNAHSTRRAGDFARLYDQQTDEAVRFADSRLLPFPLPQQEGQFDLTMELVDAGDRADRSPEIQRRPVRCPRWCAPG